MYTFWVSKVQQTDYVLKWDAATTRFQELVDGFANKMADLSADMTRHKTLNAIVESLLKHVIVVLNIQREFQINRV